MNKSKTAYDANIEVRLVDEELAMVSTNIRVYGEGLRDVKLSVSHGVFTRI